MSQTTRAAAAATLAEVEQVTALVLPEPGGEIVPLETAPAQVADEIRARMAELDIRSTQSIIGFGSKAQAELQVISQEMLQDVKNKDVGPAGDALAQIVTTIRSIELDASGAGWNVDVALKQPNSADFIGLTVNILTGE